MKKLISILLSTLLIIALFVPMSLTPVSAAAEASTQTVWELANENFGGSCSSQPGPNAGDTTSVVFNGGDGGFGNNKTLTGIENGVYAFTVDVISSGGAGNAKIGVNDGSERFVNAFAYTEWTTVTVMAKVTNNKLVYGLIWMSGSNAGNWVRIDNMRLEKVDVLEHTGYNIGSTSNASDNYVNDVAIGADIAAGAGGMLLKKRLVLEPYTTYTLYVPIWNNGMSGTLSVFSSDNTSNEFKDDGGASYNGTASVSISDSTAAWIVKKVEFTTSLTGVVWLKSWLTGKKDAATKLRISGLSIIKKDVATNGYVPFEKFTVGDSRFTIQDGGFVTGKEAVMNLTAGNASYFAPRLTAKLLKTNFDKGFYVISAYVKVSADASIEWWGGNGSDANTGRYTNKFNLKADEGWQYISSQFYVTDADGHYGWWIPHVAQDTTFTFDGFKIEKLSEVSIDDTTFAYCKSTPTRFARVEALGWNSEIFGNTTEEAFGANGNITLEPDTEYIMYFNRKTTVGGDITISSGSASSSKLYYKASNGWVTEQVKFKTDSTGATKISIWFGKGGQHHFDGFAYRKVNEANVDKTLSVADFGVKGERWLTNPITGIVEDIITAALVRGDASGDGKVDIDDLVKLRKRLIGVDELAEKFADVNGDGSVNILDLINIKKRMAGLI